MARSRVSKSRKGKSRSPKMSRTKSRTGTIRTKSRRTKTKRANTSKVRRRGSKRSKRRRQIKNLKGGGFKISNPFSSTRPPFMFPTLLTFAPIKDFHDEVKEIQQLAFDTNKKFEEDIPEFTLLNDVEVCMIVGYCALYHLTYVTDNINGLLRIEGTDLKIDSDISKYNREQLHDVAKLMEAAYRATKAAGNLMCKKP